MARNPPLALQLLSWFTFVSSLLWNALLARDVQADVNHARTNLRASPRRACDVTASQPTLPKPGASARFHFFLVGSPSTFPGMGRGHPRNRRLHRHLTSCHFLPRI